MCLPFSWLVVGGLGYYLVAAFVRHRSSVWVGVVEIECGFACIAHCIDCMNERAGDVFAVELVSEQYYRSGTEYNLFQVSSLYHCQVMVHQI